MKPQINGLFIPQDILTDKSLKAIDKLLLALEKQYPTVSKKDIALCLNIQESAYHKRKRHLKRNTVQMDSPAENKNTVQMDTIHPLQKPKKEQDIKMDTVQMDSPAEKKNTVQMDTLTHRNNVNKVLKFIKTLTSQEIYNEKRKRILEIYTHKELFTDEDFALFDEKIDEMRSKFEEM